MCGAPSDSALITLPSAAKDLLIVLCFGSGFRWGGGVVRGGAERSRTKPKHHEGK